MGTAAKMNTVALSVRYGDKLGVDRVSLEIPSGRVLALIGPSGCGKSTFLRSLNRMNDGVPGIAVSGRVEFEGIDVYDRAVDPVSLRRRIGMVFQRPNPFPKSIFENVAYGLRIVGGLSKRAVAERVERALVRAGLFPEVKDRLAALGTELSGGQQQRLCLARALAVEPEVLLMDEPASALDPIATDHLEALIRGAWPHPDGGGGHPQPGPGPPRRSTDRVLLHGSVDRGWPHCGDLRTPEGPTNPGLRDRRFWMNPGRATAVVWGLFALACDRSLPPELPPVVTTSTGLQGTIRASGSSALQPLLNLAKERFERLYPRVSVEISGGGSKKGLADVAAGSVDLGASDVPAPPDLGPVLTDHPIATLVYAPMAHRGPGTADLRGLPRLVLAEIFSGERRDWAEVGGGRGAIVVINRAAGSGTRQVFSEVIMAGRPFLEAQNEENSGALVAKLERTPGAISYLSLAFERPGLLTLGLIEDGRLVLPTVEDVEQHRWPLQAVAHLYTRGPPSPLVAEFLAFLRAPELEGPMLQLGGFVPMHQDARAEVSP